MLPIVVAVAVALVVVAGIGYMALPAWKTASVAVPPDDASPAQVVTAYLHALDAHDCSAARRMTDLNARDTVGSFCTDVAHARLVRLGPFTSERPSDSGLPRTDDAVFDVATVRITSRFLHGSGSIPSCAGCWGYVLARTSHRAPWRIVDEGSG